MSAKRPRRKPPPEEVNSNTETSANAYDESDHIFILELTQS